MFSKLSQLWRRLLFYIRRDRFDRELEEEMRFHLEMKAEENLAAGISPEEARYAARRQFGNQTLLREMSRDMWGFRSLEALAQDLRQSLRMMIKNLGFTAVAVLTLALVIGANTAIFSVVNAVMLRPLPYHQPERLVAVYEAQPDSAEGLLPAAWAYPRFEMLREQSRNFSAVAGYTKGLYTLTGAGEPERLRVELVSASYFPLLGIDAIVGRVFAAEEDKGPGANQVALIGYSLWQRRFGGDAQVIGKTIELDNHLFNIVGVAPPGFRGQDGDAEAWAPISAAELLRSKGDLANQHSYWLQVIARLNDGVTLTQAQAELGLISERIEQAFPSMGQMQSSGTPRKVAILTPLQSSRVDPAIKRSFLILLVAAGLVLLIACANMANLTLARSVGRSSEFAVRLALGASRLRLLRQLLTESVLLALVGGTLGVLIAHWGIVLLLSFRPSDNAQFWTSYARTFDFFTINLDWRALAFNFLLALITGGFFGLLPALQASRANVNEVLKGVGPLGGFRPLRRRIIPTRGLLVVCELALSLALLISAGLMIKSLARLHAVSLGFAPENVITMSAPMRKPRLEYYEQLLARVQSLPGVEAAGLGSSAPLLGHSSQTLMEIEGRTTNKMVGIGIHSVSPDYFKTLGINLIKGRVFTSQDRIGTPRVAVINQAAAEQIFRGEEPLGKGIKPFVGPTYETEEQVIEIVGVVGDAKYGRIEDAVEPDVYLSALQPTERSQTLIVRSSVDPAAIAAAVRRESLALDKNVPLTRVQTMSERVAEVTSRTRFIALLLGLFAGLALLLSVIGIYGVMAYSVSARTRELGIRIALGAQAGDVLRLVLRESLTLIGVGLALGLLAAWGSQRALKSQLYEVSSTDAPTFILIALLFLIVALLACWIPARRATKVDPITALRFE
jgi:putative ABC transport system permease protein